MHPLSTYSAGETFAPVASINFYAKRYCFQPKNRLKNSPVSGGINPTGTCFGVAASYSYTWTNEALASALKHLTTILYKHMSSLSAGITYLWQNYGFVAMLIKAPHTWEQGGKACTPLLHLLQSTIKKKIHSLLFYTTLFCVVFEKLLISCQVALMHGISACHLPC